jgi:hypothetical protein
LNFLTFVKFSLDAKICVKNDILCDLITMHKCHVFFDGCRKKKFLLLVDNCSAHPNTTSVLKPLDQGTSKCISKAFTHELRIAFGMLNFALQLSPKHHLHFHNENDIPLNQLIGENKKRTTGRTTGSPT